jgi:tRNA1Val (adenine37-N6)-methyltransferase
VTADPTVAAAAEGDWGHLLGGRVRYAQPSHGFRSGIEPVLLAAALPLRPGQRILEAGTGAGAALLCARHRVPGVVGLGVDWDADMIRLAQGNARANEWSDLVHLVADIEALPVAGPFDHACANPPYHPAGGTGSPVAQRERAKRGAPGLLGRWAMALGRVLRHRGTLTFILPAASLDVCLRAMDAADCAADTVFPLWPKPNRPAGLMLVQGVRNGRGPLRLLPGMVLHRADGAFTAEADSVLRDGAALRLR